MAQTHKAPIKTKTAETKGRRVVDIEVDNDMDDDETSTKMRRRHRWDVDKDETWTMNSPNTQSIHQYQDH